MPRHAGHLPYPCRCLCKTFNCHALAAGHAYGNSIQHAAGLINLHPYSFATHCLALATSNEVSRDCAYSALM